jgi:hypothetical protein
MSKTMMGMMIAGAVASMLSAGTAVADSKSSKANVKCAGVNSCKGHGSCSGADNSCKGQNGCKGQGWISVSAKDCSKKGGSVVADSKPAATAPDTK